MPVTLINISNRPFTVSLYHEMFCAGGGPCKCVRKTFKHPVSDGGTIRMTIENKLEPASLHIPAKGRLLGLHHAVLHVPQVNFALKRAKPPTLRSIVEPDAAPPKPASVAQTTTPSSDSGESESSTRSRRSRRRS